MILDFIFTGGRKVPEVLETNHTQRMPCCSTSAFRPEPVPRKLPPYSG